MSDSPKRPKSAYIFFCTENRQKVIDENPGIKFPDIGKKLGKLWKNMSDSEKEPYIKLAEADKERFKKGK